MKCCVNIVRHVERGLALFFVLLLSLSACSDYAADYDDKYGYMLADESDDDSDSADNVDSDPDQEASSSSDVIQSSSSSAVPSGGEDFGDSVSSSSSAIKDGYDAATNTLTDSRDNQIYKTVTIGSQIWMAQNLNYDYNKKSAKSYCYNNNADFCVKYGRLYLWSAAMDSAAVFSTAGKGCGDGKTCASTGSATFVRGVCPEGWHLPNDDEWNVLFAAIGGESTAGTKLKSTSGWYNSGNGDGSFDFAVLPSGRRTNDGNFLNAGNDGAYFWSSTERDGKNAYEWYFYYSGVNVFHSRDDKSYGFSVRCLRDSN